MLRESQYQREVINQLNDLFPGCIILKNDAQLVQGIPDLIVLYHDRWAALEVKAYPTAPERPNQRHYISRMNRMSFGSFIYPENEEVVLNALQQAFRP